MPPKIQLCTSTLYREGDDVRVGLCLEMIQNAQKLGLELVIVDAGSTNEKFLEGLKGVDKNLVRIFDTNDSGSKIEGMGEPRRLSFYLAAGGSFNDWIKFKRSHPNEEYNYYENVNPKEGDYYLWLEPEKSPLLTQENLDSLVEATQEGKVPVIVPERDVEAMDSLPPFQMYAETSANWEANRRLRDFSPGYMDADLWFGPKLFDAKEGLKVFLRDQGKMWDCIISPVAVAVKQGLKVGRAFVNFRYPVSQQEEESNTARSEFFENKRIEQLQFILAAIDKALRPQINGSLEVR